jgi:hypothetical protein
MAAHPCVGGGGLGDAGLKRCPRLRRSSSSRTPNLPSATSRSGTLLAQSPELSLPTDNAYGIAWSLIRGSGAVLRRASRLASAAWIGRYASIALIPVSRVLAWVALPATSIRKVNAPALAVTRAPPVGSVMMQASPVWPRRSVPKAPSPPSSSLTAKWAAIRPRSLAALSWIAPSAARLATSPAFMSQAPRAWTTSPVTFGMNGFSRHCAGSPGGTTST